ncbi:NAD(P)-dependent oxidoreductase [Saccharopolyspora dendranthemae]|uniref:Putative NADH-flavin reductase n=1 Tax=Saccharopolyspora dendranthemae TaxID=1181886 RepID=A0A561U292_9PSEU|nr:SDR family oxidoreductase [Saccharopolyspora dendranthemae]TWF93485.1 putative NADH-flavin reductase [Saccharopolyspora dendranthemae]
MRLAIFGATGGTGAQLVEQACAAGHAVTAVVRDASALDPRARLTTVEADVMDPAVIAPHLKGKDAVISAIGSRSAKKPTTVQTDTTRSILEAMAEAGARRFLVISNSGMISDPADDVLTRRVVKPLLWRFLKHPWTDMGRMEDLLRASDVDWTIIRPPMLTDKPGRGVYRTATNVSLPGGRTLARADLAHCVLQNLADTNSSHATVTVAD